MRQDGLPRPVSGTELYLAAILDELRTRRQPGSVAVEDPTGHVEFTEPHPMPGTNARRRVRSRSGEPVG